MKYSYAEFIPVFKALADETRIKIVDMLSCGEMCACKILESFNITQPTLSYHMKILTDCGLVVGKRDGAWMIYSMKSESVEQLKDFWVCITTECDDCICKKCEEKLDC